MKHLICCLLLVGCGDEFSNRSLDLDGEFVAAAPSGAVLRIGGPGGQGPTLLFAVSGPPAETYVLTRQVSLTLNGFAFGLLREIDALVAELPAERVDGRRVWLPPAHALDPIEGRFEMTRTEDGFDYVLGQRRRSKAGEYRPVITGRFLPDDGPGQGTGSLTFDLGVAAALTGTPGQGKLHVDYVQRADFIELVLRFEGVSPDGDDAPVEDVLYQQTPDGGVLDFAFRADGTVVRINSRWRSDGAGRADGLVEGGSRFSECWAEDFTSVFYADDGRTLGDPEGCVFGEASQP